VKYSGLQSASDAKRLYSAAAVKILPQRQEYAAAVKILPPQDQFGTAADTAAGCQSRGGKNPTATTGL
jgi:hypothetical protein